MCVKVKVKDVPKGIQFCVDDTSHVSSLAVEPTLSRIKENYLTEALVVKP